MNSNTLRRIALITAIIAAVSLLIAGVIGGTTGAFRALSICGIHFNGVGRTGGVAIDERKSLPTTGVSRIAATGVSEDVTVREGTGDSITAWFHGKVSSSERPHLHVSLHGDAADIRIERQRHVGFGWSDSDAVLEVSIPKQYAGKLSVESVSGDITLTSHNYTDLTLATTSGDIAADAVKSGNLTLDTASGDVRTQRLTADRAEIESVSGDVDMKAFSGDVDAHSTSGGVAVTFTAMPSKIDIETVSGDVHLKMPQRAEFALDAGSTSGEVTCDFPITITNTGAEHSLGGAVGSAKGKITVHTVSGDVAIARNGGI